MVCIVCPTFVLTKTNKIYIIMNTKNNNNRTQKNWNTFAFIVTIITAVIVVGGAFQIFINL